MELTNLIWHLGAVVAALWAGFSYRTLLLRHQELEMGVLVSLLPQRASTDEGHGARLSQRQLSLIRSVRVRALGWYGDEALRRRGCVLDFGEKETLLSLPDDQWRALLACLQAFLQRSSDAGCSPGASCVVRPASAENGEVGWTLSAHTGEKRC